MQVVADGGSRGCHLAATRAVNARSFHSSKFELSGYGIFYNVIGIIVRIVNFTVSIKELVALSVRSWVEQWAQLIIRCCRHYGSG
jgi:hypothetical protein